MNLNNWIQHWY